MAGVVNQLKGLNWKATHVYSVQLYTSILQNENDSHLHTCIARSASRCSCPRTRRRRSPARARLSPPGLRPSAGSGSTSRSPAAASASCWRLRKGLSRESRGSCRGASTVDPRLPKPGAGKKQGLIDCQRILLLLSNYEL